MFKRFFRSAAVQSSLGALIWAYMAVIGRTLRWRVEGADAFQKLWESEQGFLAASWHSRILLLPVVQTRLARRWKPPPHKAAIVISHSPDGAFVAKASERLGLALIRGSASNKKKSKDKGGLGAVRDTMRLLKQGAAVCITPDGPRGPRETVGPGVIRTAQMAGAPIFVYALAAAPARRLKTWDRFLLPLPFGRGVVVFDGPIKIGKDADLEAERADLERRLRAATARAEQLAGLTPIGPPASASKSAPETPIASADTVPK